MAGVEVIPVAILILRALPKGIKRLIELEAESVALAMIATNVEDDIKDAIMFHTQLSAYVYDENELKARASVAIDRAKEALEYFKAYLKENPGFWDGVQFVLFDRAKVRQFQASLQSAQSNLARRIDWMRSAIAALAAAKSTEG